MVSSVAASKRAPLAVLLKELLAAPPVPGKKTVASAPGAASLLAARRVLGTGAAPFRGAAAAEDDDDTEGSGGDDASDGGRSARGFYCPMFLSSDVMDQFGEPTKLSRLLALMEDGAAATGSGGAAGVLSSARGWWVAKVDDDAVHLKVPMPGLGKEHVKVWAEQNVVVVKGERDKDPEDDDAAGGDAHARYTRRIELAADAFKMDQIKAEMKNGVLRVTVPKIKHEERKDVFQVTVE